MMISPGKRKKSLNLEKDLRLTRDDFIAIATPQPHEPGDLTGYLDFLDEVWGTEKIETEKKFFPEPFQL